MKASLHWSRRALLASALAVAAAAPAASLAQAWTSRSIKLIVPFASGGSNDDIARVLGTKLSARPGHKGISLAFNDVLGGSLQMMLPSVASPLIKVDNLSVE